MDTTGLPPSGSAHGDALENLTLTVKVTVANTGQRAGSVPVMVAYSKQTRGVVRNLRDLAGFTKVHLLPGESMERTLAVPVGQGRRRNTEEKGTLAVPVGQGLRPNTLGKAFGGHPQGARRARIAPKCGEHPVGARRAGLAPK